MEIASEMSGNTIPLFISAGDPSGDIAGSLLLRELKASCSGLSFIGLGGERMKAAGQEQTVPGSALAVMGFWEVARKFRFFRKLLSDTVETIRERKPRAVILIDYPGFNLRLAEMIEPFEIPIIYYISPQIWAWGANRITKIRKSVDLMLVILPFEKQIYDKAGVRSEFVGHYLLDDMERKHIKAPYNSESDLIMLMPGSRPQEVQRMLPTMLDAAEILAIEGKWRYAIAAVDTGIEYTSYLEQRDLPVEIVKGHTRELIADSRLVITSSGTATLETGIIGRPMIVVYKTGVMTYIIARLLIKIDKVALINICGEKKIVPELIQGKATAERIAAEASRFLADPTLARNVISELNKTVDRLGSSGSVARAAGAILEYINC